MPNFYKLLDKTIFFISCLFLIFILVVNFLDWYFDILEPIKIFFFFIYYPILFSMFLISAVYIFSFAITAFIKKEQVKKAIFLIVFSFVVYSVSIFSYVLGDNDKLLFRFNYNNYEHIVSQILENKLTITNNNSILLPFLYRPLSRGGGEAFVLKKKGKVEIQFFIIRGILDNFSCYIYRSDDQIPTDNGEKYWKCIKLRDHWFLVYST